VGKVGDLPDLRFMRRTDLGYSFCGEKLTGEQAELAFARVRDLHPELSSTDVQFALVPALEGGYGDDMTMFYRLVVAHASNARPRLRHEDLARDVDQCLRHANTEFLSKQNDGRLGRTVAVPVGYDRIAALLSGSTGKQGRPWEAQFKLLPIYARRWDQLGLPDVEDLR
jgi:hypothetical protein